MSQGFSPALLAGKFIVFDGPDGCGKTTQLQLFIDVLRKAGMAVKQLREPGGTPIGEQIRDLLLSQKGEGMHVRCEMLLYMASRAQLVQQEITPALAAGQVVVADRYASSTIAYQGAGGGLPMDSIMQVADIAVDGVWPNLTLILDISIEAAMTRLMGSGSHDRTVHASQPGLFSDRIEQRDAAYHRRVREGFLGQMTRWPERYRLVDASKPIKNVQQQIMEAIAAFFNGQQARGAP